MGESPVLVIYSRPSCHLCDIAKSVATPIARRYGVRVQERNVEERAEWESAYGQQVPVGFLGSTKLFKYRVDAARLESAIRNRISRHYASI